MIFIALYSGYSRFKRNKVLKGLVTSFQNMHNITGLIYKPIAVVEPSLLCIGYIVSICFQSGLVESLYK